MPFRYKSGEEVRPGDRVILSGEPGKVEFVVDKTSGDPALDWYPDEFGGGVMVVEPKNYGSVFFDEPEDAGRV